MGALFRSMRDSIRNTQALKRRTRRIAVRFPRLNAMVQRRLSRDEQFGLHVTAGVMLTLCFMWLFFRVAFDIIGRESLLGWDLGILDYFRGHRNPVRDEVMLFFTTLGNWQVVSWGMICVVLFLSMRKQWRRIAAILVSAIGGSAFVMIMKAVVQRPRPPLALALTQARNFSFPSGHSFVAFSFYGLLAYFLFRSLRGSVLRTLALLAGAGVMIGIGASRAYLGVHWPSDVLASFASGAAWLTVLITALETYPDQRRLPVLSARRSTLLCAALLFAWLAYTVVLTRTQRFAPYRSGKPQREHVQRGGYERPVTFVATEYIRSVQVT
jgi:undecaprenyl-diphosphatase